MKIKFTEHQKDFLTDTGLVEHFKNEIGKDIDGVYEVVEEGDDNLGKYFDIKGINKIFRVDQYSCEIIKD